MIKVAYMFFDHMLKKWNVFNGICFEQYFMSLDIKVLIFKETSRVRGENSRANLYSLFYFVLFFAGYFRTIPGSN